MKMRSILLTAFLFASPAFAGSQTYECEVAAPKFVSFDGDKVSAQTMEGLPPEALQFKLKISDKNARVDWENSPIQMSGENPIFPTGKESGSVLFLSSGPCMFTDGACGSMLNFSKQPEGGLEILISPTAFVSDSEAKKTTPFLVAIQGKCSLGKSNK